MRFNPPPNWPRPPAGWTPPPGWAPDPAWGDAPPDWQYWLPDPAPSYDEPPPLPGFVLDTPTELIGTPDGAAAPHAAEHPTVPISATPTLLAPPGEPLTSGPASSGPASSGSLPAPTGAYAQATGATGPDAPRRRGFRRAKVLVPTAVVLVAGLVGGGLYGNQAWQERQERIRIEKAHQRLKDAYAAGHAAFLAGDCRTAAPQFTAVADPVLEPDLTTRAAAEKAACAKLEITRGATGDPAAKVVAYLDYIAGGPGAPLQPIATKEVVALFTGAPADTLVSVDLCNRVDAIREVVLTSDAARARSMPGLLLRCSDQALKDGDPQTAEDGYRQIRADYAKAPEAARATTSLAKLIVADGKKGEHRTVPTPLSGSRDSKLDGKVRLTIYNGTPQEMQLVVSGSTGVIGTAAACSSCKVFDTAAQAKCAFKGSHITLTVPAGKYAVDLRFPDVPIRPAIGTWTLRADRVYEACFYVAKR